MRHSQSVGIEEKESSREKNTGQAPQAGCAWLIKKQKMKIIKCTKHERPCRLCASVTDSCITKQTCGLQACAPFHMGLSTGCSCFLPGQWLASKRHCPKEPGRSFFTCSGSSLRNVSCPPQSKVHSSSRKGDTDPTS